MAVCFGSLEFRRMRVFALVVQVWDGKVVLS